LAGYSVTPLAGKLGITPGHVVVLRNAPRGFERVLREAGFPEHATLRGGTFPGPARGLKRPAQADVVVFFTTSDADLRRAIAGLEKSITPAGGLWIAWPKRASGVTTDMTEDVIRDIALPRGLVDNKVCAIDDIWSGLRLVIRRENRPKAAPSTRRTTMRP
jgi:hypothetical protein